MIDLSANIGTLLWNVTSVSYTLHVPAGRGVVAVIRTPSWPTTKETFTILADQEPGRYDSTTIVRTASPGVAVSVDLLVLTRFATKSGLAGQPLNVAIRTR